MTYQVRELADAVVRILKREWEYIKPNLNPGPWVGKGNSILLNEIDEYGGIIETTNSSEQVRIYQQGHTKFDATFRKAPGGNPYWYITDCGKTINGDPRKSIEGFELKPKVTGLETLV